MSFIVRRRTIGKAESLIRDLTANLGNVSCESANEFWHDLALWDAINSWLLEETANETKVVTKCRKLPRKK
jgi:hypothetical protein